MWSLEDAGLFWVGKARNPARLVTTMDHLTWMERRWASESAAVGGASHAVGFLRKPVRLVWPTGHRRRATPREVYADIARPGAGDGRQHAAHGAGSPVVASLSSV